MKAGKMLTCLCCIGCAVLLSSCAGKQPPTVPSAEKANTSVSDQTEIPSGDKTSVPTADKASALYACNCGPDCKCNTVSIKTGNCSCSKELTGFHVLGVNGDQALLCQCDVGCTCKMNKTNATECGCGKPVKRVSLKGTGVYFCNCGNACRCNTFADAPGKCSCGMDLKLAE
jgi:hypothetical protein